MKRNLTVILITAICLASICCLITYAHPGRTDQNGGHYNHSTGEYHYHHGEPEHQHPNGTCPYATEESDSSKIGEKILIFFAGVVGIPLYVNIFIFGFISEIINSISSKFKKKRIKKEKSEEELLFKEEEDAKIYSFSSILLYIIEIVIWAIIVFKW